MPRPEIFFSYAWGDENEQATSREEVVNQLYDSLVKDHYPIVRDKYDLQYKGLINGFMDRIGKAPLIILIISDKYLKSHNCMYELLSIYRKSNSDFDEMKEKIFPVILSDAKIFNAEDISNYTAYWEGKTASLQQELAGNLANRTELTNQLALYKEVSFYISRLLALIGNMNTLNLSQLSANDFAELKNSINGRARIFRFSNPTLVLNEALVIALVQAIHPYNDKAKKLFNEVNDSPEWIKDDEAKTIACNLISSLYPGFIGIQLTRLWAIGKEALSDERHKTYIINCFLGAKRTLQLLCFAFLAKLWDYKIGNAYVLSEKDAATIKSFFDRTIEPGIEKYLELLQVLVNTFSAFPTFSPFSELDVLEAALKNDSEFVESCRNINSIRKDLNSSPATLEACLEIEAALAVFFSSLSFLCAYKMVSMKEVSYYLMRNLTPHYLHNYTALGMEKDKMNIERVIYQDVPGNTDAILLFTTNYWTGTNLFPFMIDFNALNLESGTKVFFYSSKDNFDDNSLNYCFWENDTIKNISEQESDEQPKDRLTEAIKQLRKKNVFIQFEEAKRVILDIRERPVQEAV